MERDTTIFVMPPTKGISTHTLTWSVTYALCAVCRDRIISTHTLTWSVTRFETDTDTAYAISTHTLTWSVTQKFGKLD